jgi:hypothetical protein
VAYQKSRSWSHPDINSIDIRAHLILAKRKLASGECPPWTASGPFVLALSLFITYHEARASFDSKCGIIGSSLRESSELCSMLRNHRVLCKVIAEDRLVPRMTN